jgi:hypothetical protein
MGATISNTNKKYINDNWDKLKCSPIGPFLQMLGIAPGDVNNTSNMCTSSQFSTMFNASIVNQLNVTNKLSKGMNIVSDTLNSFRTVIASIQQKAFEDISNIAKIIFGIYVKIGNIFFLMIKHLTNIMKIFKQTINFATSISILLISFINLLRKPVNGVIDFVNAFKRTKNVGNTIKSGAKKVGRALKKAFRL